MPGIVFLKDVHGRSAKTELAVSAGVEEMLVSDLKSAVEKKLGIPADDQSVFSTVHKVFIIFLISSVVVCWACNEAREETTKL